MILANFQLVEFPPPCWKLNMGWLKMTKFSKFSEMAKKSFR